MQRDRNDQVNVSVQWTVFHEVAQHSGIMCAFPEIAHVFEMLGNPLVSGFTVIEEKSSSVRKFLCGDALVFQAVVCQVFLDDSVQIR